jgi:hypothetical protein
VKAVPFCRACSAPLAPGLPGGPMTKLRV